MKTEITATDDGLRVDNVIRRVHRNVSYAFLQKIFRAGKVKIENRSVAASHRIRAGDVISIYANLPPSGEATTIPDPNSDYAQKLRLQFKSMIIFENKDIIAINKPARLAVQMGTKVPICVETLAGLYQTSPEDSCRLVHRIDKDTSGVLLLAKNLATARIITELFRENRMEKTYLAVVAGKISGSGVMDAPMQDGDRKLPAVTFYRSLKSSNNYSLLELKPRSGRKHQLRIHCANLLQAPICGDVKYGDASKSGELLLHASRIRSESIPLDVAAELPEYFVKFLADNFGPGADFSQGK
ncbi:MAG: RluA family pseudouridine synthase [Holosporaceae bacterium]|jgi:23S rRNA pseudouridine955/2504/2580 synthase|nr:RluA family pseudouridine synthase [Holosporaceae bacterium]